MNNKKLKLLFCTDGIYPLAIGGMQRHSALLLEELIRLDELDITLIHPHAEKIFKTGAIKEIPLNYTPKGNYLKSCYAYSKLVNNEIEKLDPEVIYSQGLSVWNGISKTGKKVIVNPHGLEPFQALTFSDKLKTIPLRMAERYIFNRAAKVVSLGGGLTGILRNEIRNTNNKICILPNATNLAPVIQRNYNKDKLRLLFVGRFAFNKGINLLMDAVSKLNAEGYKDLLHFNLVGKGPLYEEYRKKYNFDNVTFVGFADDDTLAKMYRENDLFVFPTLFEGMPTVVLEAMANGLPVIVSDTGATADLVNSSNGFLIETNNVRALKWGIQSFYQLNAEQRTKLSHNSFEKVKNKFTWPIVARQHIELFNTFRSAS